MSPLARLLLVLTLLVAVVDWIAVGVHARQARIRARASGGGEPTRIRNTVDYVAKPATMVMLALFLMAMTAGGPQPRGQVLCFLAAVVLSLAGDVFLMLPRDLFLAGLVSFLLAHVAYIVGIVAFGHVLSWSGPVLAWMLILIGTIPIARRLLASIEDPAERTGVTAYMGVITLMVAAAWTLPWRTGVPLAAGVAGAVGATLFFASDSMIGLRRFVRAFPGADVLIIVTYHLGQIGLVLSLAR